MPNPHHEKCVAIADRVMPEYRCGKKPYGCTGQIAKRWAAAYIGAQRAMEESNDL